MNFTTAPIRFEHGDPSPEHANSVSDSNCKLLLQALIENLREHRPIEAIKLIRSFTGLGLKDSKDLFERVAQSGHDYWTERQKREATFNASRAAMNDVFTGIKDSFAPEPKREPTFPYVVAWTTEVGDNAWMVFQTKEEALDHAKQVVLNGAYSARVTKVTHEVTEVTKRDAFVEAF